MKTIIRCFAIALLAGLPSQSSLMAQEMEMPQPTAEHEILKQDVGTWDAKVTMHDDTDEGSVSNGVETNNMLGGFWVHSTFKGDFGGMTFEGVSMLGYDATQQRYVGTWIDSMTPNPMKMTGTYDAEKKTMTMATKSTGPGGEPIEGKSILVYESDDKRTMTMFEKLAGSGEFKKTMTIEYTRKADTTKNK